MANGVKFTLAFSGIAVMTVMIYQFWNRKKFLDFLGKLNEIDLMVGESNFGFRNLIGSSFFRLQEWARI